MPRLSVSAPLVALLAALLLAPWGREGGARAADPPMSARAADPPMSARRLENVEKALEKGQHEHERLQRESQSLSDELAAVKEGLVKAANSVQEQEDFLTEYEDKLAALQGREAEIRDGLSRRRDQSIHVLMALQRMAWRPTEALVAQPLSPAATVRSAILLRAAL
ncbi:MAG: peptidase M23, partial [Alphaproteobacteria bacterium]|nr:peptidase M23 [Alphaproteobacteria bacterium]